MQLLPDPKPPRPKRNRPSPEAGEDRLAVVLTSASGHPIATYEVAPRTRGALRAAAARRETNEAALAARILGVVAGDKLFEAVLDDGQPPAPKRHRVTKDRRNSPEPHE